MAILNHETLYKNYTNQVNEWRKDCEDRIKTLRNAIRNAKRGCNPIGEKITPSSAQTIHTRSKRDLVIVWLVDSLLFNIEKSIKEERPAKLLLPPSAFRGLEKLLYPIQRRRKNG